MSEVDLIIHILASLSEEYEVTVSNLEDRLMELSPQMPLGIENVCEKIILCHDRVKQHKKDESDKQAYFAPQKQYKAPYQKCGEYGHKPDNPCCSKLKHGIHDMKLASSKQDPKTTSSDQDPRTSEEDPPYFWGF